MNITINTDASFCPHTRVGGYAFYIVCNQFKIQKAGKFQTLPKSATEAEAMCIGNAFATLLAQELPEKVNHLIVNTDCLPAIDHIKRFGGIYKIVRKLQHQSVMKTKARKFEYRHVKAHNGTPDARSWVNDWCDREAKKYMRQARKELGQLN